MFKGIILPVASATVLGFSLGFFVLPAVPILHSGEEVLLSIDGGALSYLRCNRAGFSRKMFIEINGRPLYTELSIGRVAWGELDDSSAAVALCTG